ncbi:MAG: hypothetical protein ACR2PK_08060 [Acidimicrobiales bacterium]
MAEDDNFGGAWLVTEYVYDPDGSFVGIVEQRRLVESLADGRLRVTQVCSPGPELEDHAMGAFAGEWVFDLEVHGADRHYLGPDVVGMGTEWAPGAMTGQGLWPRFGHSFESYAVLVAPDRQLTGGFFSIAGRSVADIVGVAVPESAGVVPEFDLAVSPPEVEETWTLQRTVGPMRIAEARPDATTRRRLWTMADSVSESKIEMLESTTAGTRSVSSSVLPA